MITRARPSKCQDVLNKMVQNTQNLNNIELLVLIDDDEPYASEYRLIINEFKAFLSTKLVQVQLDRNTKRFNYLANLSTGDLIFLLCDDMILEKNWDQSINIEANKFKQDDAFCVWTRETIPMRTYLHNNAPVISRVWFKRCGYYISEAFYHYCADIWLCDLCRGTGRFILTKNMIYTHLHPHNFPDEVKVDQTLFETIKKSDQNDDAAVYFKLHENLEEMAAQIRD